MDIDRYGDSDVWWDVERYVPGKGWTWVSDHDTFERAEIARHASQSLDPDHDYRTHKVRGQA